MSLEKKLRVIFDELDVDFIETWSKQDILKGIKAWKFDSKGKVIKELGKVAQQIREMREEISTDVTSCSYLCRENKCPLQKKVLGLLVEEGEK